LIEEIQDQGPALKWCAISGVEIGEVRGQIKERLNV